jgi:hypothetical protein
MIITGILNLHMMGGTGRVLHDPDAGPNDNVMQEALEPLEYTRMECVEWAVCRLEDFDES